MSKINFIGDSHGKWDQLLNLLPKDELSISVGDLNIGLKKCPTPPLPEYFKFIFGNHDNPRECLLLNNCLGKIGIFEHESVKIGYVSGAKSIDKIIQMTNGDWFENEELSNNEFSKGYELIVSNTPDIMVSHDAPISIIKEIFTRRSNYLSRTSIFLDDLYNECKPKYWIFGHHHTSIRYHTHSTEFIGLSKLELCQIEI